MSYLPAVAFGASGGVASSGSSRSAGGVYLPRVDFTAPTPTVPAPTLNQTATPIAEQQTNLAAENAPLRLCYGRVRLGAQIANIVPHGSHWIIQCVWGEGPIDAVEALHADDAALPAGASVVHYLGTAGQGVDPWLQAAFALAGLAYADTLPYVAYSVVRWPAAASSGLPQLVATLRGLKTDSGVWSDNAALALADVIRHERYGLAAVVEATGLAATQAACAETIGGAPRRRIGLVIDHVQGAAQWLDALRTYAGCWVVPAGAEVRFVPDRPRAIDASLTHGDSQIRSLSPIKKRGLTQAPTAIEIRYTDTAALPWREASAWAFADGVLSGSVPRRESQVALPGIQYASQAYREAVERLNKLTLSDLTVTFEVFDAGTQFEVGDVVELTHPWGLDAKALRILGVDHDYQVHRLTCVEYDPAMYSDAIVAESTTPDTTLPNPSTPPAVTGLTLTEEVYQLDNGTYASRIAAIWTNPEWPYPFELLFEVWAAGSPVYATRARGAIARSPAVQEGVAYTVKVALVAGVYVGAYATAAITAQGKELTPGDVPSISAFEAGGRVYAAWQPAIDIDIWRYEVRYGTTGWDAAKLIDRVDALRLTSDQIPVGTWTLYVKALDSVGHYSANAAAVAVTVTTDAGAFLIDTVDQVAPMLTNMVAYRLDRTDPNTYYVTEDGVSLATKMPGDLATYTDDLATYHAAVTSTWLGEAHDFGQVLGGQWTGEAAVDDISGAHVSSFGFSADGSSWTYVAGLSQKANARFARLKHEASGTATLRVTVPGQRFRIDAIPREEVGEGTSSAAGPVTITLTNDYVAVKKLTITPEGNTARSATYDAITLGDPTTFDVHVFDAAGARIASPFRYQFQGV